MESAFGVTGDGRKQQLSRLWSGYYYAIPQLEGTIRVHCHDGSTKEGGYVTGHAHTELRIVGDVPCERFEGVI